MSKPESVEYEEDDFEVSVYRRNSKVIVELVHADIGLGVHSSGSVSLQVGEDYIQENKFRHEIEVELLEKEEAREKTQEAVDNLKEQRADLVEELNNNAPDKARAQEIVDEFSD